MEGELEAGDQVPWFVAFLPLVMFSLLAIPYAFGVYYLAKRMGKNKWLWAILTLVPFVNFVFAAYVVFKVIYYVIDALNELKARPA